MMMKWHILATIILIQLKTFHCNIIELSSYSKVIKNGNANEQFTSTTMIKPERKHRAREGVIASDLWFPKIFNSSDASESTGRSTDRTRPFSYPLKEMQFPTYSRPSNHRSSHEPRIIYASNPVQQVAQDRFVPRESFEYFLEKNKNRVKSSPKESDREDDGPLQSNAPMQSNEDDQQPLGPVYKPPKDLYSFPPNSESTYLPPDGSRKPISHSSYLPPPSGPSDYPIYPGPTNPNNISPLHTQVDNSGSSNNDMKSNDDNGDDDNKDADSDDSSPDRPSDDMKLVDRPPADFVPSKKPSIPSFPYPDDHHHYHDHDHDHDDDSFIDSHHTFDSHHLHGFDAFPEIVLDHDPHHFYDDHHHFYHALPPPPPPPPPTTPPPPPPPPPPPEPEEPEDQPRVKKYSYFYLSRSLWYIPLYFTVWFTFYVTWLILQSIGRHKVDLPNHVTSRSVRDLSHRQTVEKVNLLTEFVMTQIDDFKNKYL